MISVWTKCDPWQQDPTTPSLQLKLQWQFNPTWNTYPYRQLRRLAHVYIHPTQYEFTS